MDEHHDDHPIDPAVIEDLQQFLRNFKHKTTQPKMKEILAKIEEHLSVLARLKDEEGLDSTFHVLLWQLISRHPRKFSYVCRYRLGGESHWIVDADHIHEYSGRVRSSAPRPVLDFIYTTDSESKQDEDEASQPGSPSPPTPRRAPQATTPATRLGPPSSSKKNRKSVEDTEKARSKGPCYGTQPQPRLEEYPKATPRPASSSKSILEPPIKAKDSLKGEHPLERPKITSESGSLSSSSSEGEVESQDEFDEEDEAEGHEEPHTPAKQGRSTKNPRMVVWSRRCFEAPEPTTSEKTRNKKGKKEDEIPDVENIYDSKGQPLLGVSDPILEELEGELSSLLVLRALCSGKVCETPGFGKRCLACDKEASLRRPKRVTASAGFHTMSMPVQTCPNLAADMEVEIASARILLAMAHGHAQRGQAHATDEVFGGHVEMFETFKRVFFQPLPSVGAGTFDMTQLLAAVKELSLVEFSKGASDKEPGAVDENGDIVEDAAMNGASRAPSPDLAPDDGDAPMEAV
ncbi:hypothetical protein BKA70DRAFT_1221941 [Coprinopsis sp. MPI-PUGE-AT-0042]|nr:hypothetical protein BKA70DRAFT_1221941 [Coprinopsis sp. MPI-PUGE-AT-0042]